MECMLPVEFLLSSEKEESPLGNDLELNDTTGFYSLGDDLTQFFGSYQQLSTDYSFPEPTIDFQLDGIDSLGLYVANCDSVNFIQPQPPQPVASNFASDNSLYILKDCMAEPQLQLQTNMLGVAQSLNSWLPVDQFASLPSYSEVPITTIDNNCMDFPHFSMFTDLEVPITTTDNKQMDVAKFLMPDNSELPITSTDSKHLELSGLPLLSDSELSIITTDNLTDAAGFSLFDDSDLSMTMMDGKRLKDVVDFSMFNNLEAPMIVTDSKRLFVADIPDTTTDKKRIDVVEFSMLNNLEVPITTMGKRMDGVDFTMFKDGFVDVPCSNEAPSSFREEAVDVGSVKVVKKKKSYSKVPVEMKRLRKMEQNKLAATRYRMKKKAELENLLDEEKVILEKNEGLRMQRDELQSEVKHLKSLMHHVYLASVKAN